METAINLRKNHKFLSVSGYLKQICQPLAHLHIHLFTYLKNFHDGSQINISTHANWVADYYQLGLYKTSLFEADPARSRALRVGRWTVLCRCFNMAVNIMIATMA